MTPATAKENPEGWTFNKSSFVIFLFFLPAFFLMVLALLAAMQYKQFRAFVSPEPAVLSRITTSPQEEESVRSRVRSFFSGPGLDTLALSSEDLNHLIRTSKSLSDLNWDYHLDLTDTLLVARNSIPVKNMKGVVSTLLKLMRVKGYFNSVMAGRPDLKDGHLTLVPVSATMNGQSAPVSALSRNGNVDVREWVEDKAFYDQAIGRLGAIVIRGGRLLLIKKPTP